MSANGSTALDATNWGTSTGGAAGTAETTSTLGIDRTDNRVPPDQSHVWGAQISNVKNLLITISQFFQGGTRLRVLPQTANPFASTETGFYADNTATPVAKFSAGGTLSSAALWYYNTQSATTYTVLATDVYVGMSSSSARTVTLCAASALPAGKIIFIKDENGNAGTNNVTINRAGSDTIDGATSKTISSNSGVQRLISDGTSKWFTL